MNTQIIKKIKQGQETAFINHTAFSNLAYKPQFISNNYQEGRKVLSSIEDELLSCDQFSMSVAFITMSGITPLLQTLKELENRGIPGCILTTDYLTFSEPRALDKLADLKNIELKMYCAGGAKEGFHTKGYLFRSDEIYRIIVGSSNMTLSALTRNKEWNTKIVSTIQGEYAMQIVDELLAYGICQYKENYAHRYKATNFQLYQKYTYEDVCRLLNWKKNMNAQNIGGYFYDLETKTLPVFINYEKAEDAIAYEDRFVSSSELIALSKHPRKVTSSDAERIYKKGSENADNKIYLFVRKNKDDKEAKEFYFLGEIFAVGEPFPIHMDATNDDAFEITYYLDVPVREDIYNYIRGE